MKGLKNSSLVNKGVENFEVKNFEFIIDGEEGVIKVIFPGRFLVSKAVIETRQTRNAFYFVTRTGSCYGFEAENFREMLKLRKAAKYFTKVNGANYYKSV